MLDEVQDDGHSYRKHLERAAARGHQRAAEKLQGPGVPPELEYLLEWHMELRMARQYGQMGFAQSLTWADVHGWASLTGRRPNRLEALALMQLDVAHRAPAKD